MKRKNFLQTSLISEINVTPFVDVLLVLLVILIVTLPYMNTSQLSVNLPQESLKSNDAAAQIQTVITINVQGEYFFENKKTEVATIINTLLERRKNNKVGVVVIQSDKDLSYGKVVSLIALLKNNGFDRIGLTIEKPDA